MTGHVATIKPTLYYCVKACANTLKAAVDNHHRDQFSYAVIHQELTVALKLDPFKNSALLLKESKHFHFFTLLF